MIASKLFILTDQMVNMIIKQSLPLRLLQVTLDELPPAVLFQHFLCFLPAVVRSSDQIGQQSVEAVDGLNLKILENIGNINFWIRTS